jgi:Cu/Ag efflux pump CusA
MLMLSAVAIIAILLILFVDFQSWQLVLMIALLLPLTLSGGVIGAMLVGGVISLGSLVGFVTVLGIAARNAIMLISHYRHLQKNEGVAFGPELLLRGAQERLAPILMTALTTGLALVPLVLTGNLPGQEIEYPMAFVILGGIVSSTVLNLFMLPVAYAQCGRS